MAGLLGLFLVALAVAMLMVRYSNKKHVARATELKKKLKNLEKSLEELKNKYAAEVLEMKDEMEAIEKRLAEKTEKEEKKGK